MCRPVGPVGARRRVRQFRCDGWPTPPDAHVCLGGFQLVQDYLFLIRIRPALTPGALSGGLIELSGPFLTFGGRFRLVFVWANGEIGLRRWARQGKREEAPSGPRIQASIRLVLGIPQCDPLVRPAFFALKHIDISGDDLGSDGLTTITYFGLQDHSVARSVRSVASLSAPCSFRSGIGILAQQDLTDLSFGDCLLFFLGGRQCSV